MQCFFDSLHLLAHFYLAYAMYSGRNFDGIFTCFNIMIVPLVGLNVGMGLIFFTAVDRIVTTLFPIKHPQLNKVLYLGSFLAVCIGCNIYILYIGYLNAKENEEVMVVCLIIEGEKHFIIVVSINESHFSSPRNSWYNLVHNSMRLRPRSYPYLHLYWDLHSLHKPV